MLLDDGGQIVHLLPQIKSINMQPKRKKKRLKCMAMADVLRVFGALQSGFYI
jgi:hypothetical protein